MVRSDCTLPGGTIALSKEPDRAARYRAALRWNPIHAGYQEALSAALRDRPGPFGPSEYAETALAYERLKELAPEAASTYRGLARLELRAVHAGLAMSGAGRRATSAYLAALEWEPFDPFLMLEAAQAHLALQERKSAYVYLRAALKVEPFFARAHLEKTKALGSQGRFEEARFALGLLEEAISICAERGQKNQYEEQLCHVPEESLALVRAALREESP